MLCFIIILNHELASGFLNYIKSHTELLEHVHFVNQRIFNHKTLELALTNTDAPAIRLVKITTYLSIQMRYSNT